MAKLKFPKDLTGMKFGELTVLEYAGNCSWLCKCSCGNTKTVSRGNITSGNSTTCGDKTKHGKIEDITGKVFGDLTVISYDKKLKKWLCRCSCGNEVYRRSWDLRYGKATKCDNWDNHINKRLENLTGMQFGELTVIEYAGDSKWLCRCSCGKECIVRAYHLKAGFRTDCGHIKALKNVIDITGQKFGHLTAIRYLNNGRWLCKCDCGNEIEATTSQLRINGRTSCGCDRKSNLIDLTGQRFGNLVVIKYNTDNVKWLCQCDCGNKTLVASQHLRRGDITSCGCNKRVANKDEIIQVLKGAQNKLGRLPTLSEAQEITGWAESTLRLHLGNDYKTYIFVDNHISNFEFEIYKYIESIYNGNIEQSNRTILSGKEIDIYLPEVNIGIECNGVYWHSDLVRDKMYHQEKTIKAYKNGVRLIHVYEYEWIKNKDKIKMYLSELLSTNKHIEYARKLILKIVDKDMMNEFLNNYHLQGGCSCEIAYGLFKDNELIQLISLGKPRFSTSYEYEIIRLCTKFNHLVVGGTERLINYAIKDLKMNSIISYVNLDKFTGKSYQKMGFKTTRLSEPGYVWVNSRCTEVLSRYKTQKRELVRMGLGTEDETEDEIMQSLGYKKIYNSGNLVFVKI